MLDTRDGTTHGAVTDFASLGDGSLGLEFLQFSPDGSELLLGQGGHLLSIRPGDSVPYAVSQFRQADDGFEITFSRPVDREIATDPSAWNIEVEPILGEEGPPAPLSLKKEVRIIVDFEGLTVTWQTKSIEPDSVYRFDLSSLVSETGVALDHGPIYYTTSSQPLPGPSQEPNPENPEGKPSDPPMAPSEENEARGNSTSPEDPAPETDPESPEEEEEEE